MSDDVKKRTSIGVDQKYVSYLQGLIVYIISSNIGNKIEKRNKQRLRTEMSGRGTLNFNNVRNIRYGVLV